MDLVDDAECNKRVKRKHNAFNVVLQPPPTGAVSDGDSEQSDGEVTGNVNKFKAALLNTDAELSVGGNQELEHVLHADKDDIEEFLLAEAGDISEVRDEVEPKIIVRVNQVGDPLLVSGNVVNVVRVNQVGDPLLASANVVPWVDETEEIVLDGVP